MFSLRDERQKHERSRGESETHAIRLAAEKSFPEGKVLSGWTISRTCMWEAQIWPDSLHLVCNGFMIDTFPYGRAGHENRSQSGGAFNGDLYQISVIFHSHLSSVVCPEFTLFFSAALGCYLVLVCRAEVSLLSDMWTLFVCCVWSAHQSVSNRQTPSRECVRVCLWRTVGDRTHTQEAVQPCMTPSH